MKRKFSQSTCANSQPEEIPQVDAAIRKPGYSIVQSSDKSYKSVYLQMSNCAQNNNKFYIIQLLKSGSSTFLYTRYGRVGEPGTQNFKATSLELGEKEFNKTQNAKSRKGYKVVDI